MIKFIHHHVCQLFYFQMSIVTRSYYLWEDDKNAGKVILSEKSYYLLASTIEKHIRYFRLFRDVKSSGTEYDQCEICLDYIAKIECSKCKQRICGRCVINFKSCQFCRARM